MKSYFRKLGNQISEKSAFNFSHFSRLSQFLWREKWKGLYPYAMKRWHENWDAKRCQNYLLHDQCLNSSLCCSSKVKFIEDNYLQKKFQTLEKKDDRLFTIYDKAK